MPTGGGMGPCILPLPTTIISLDLLVLNLRLLVSANCWTPKSSSCTVCLMVDPTIKHVSSAKLHKDVCCVHRPFHQYIHPPIFPLIHPSIPPSMNPSIHPLFRRSINPSIRPSIHTPFHQYNYQ